MPVLRQAERPAAAKAVAEWFPARQRALGIGIFVAGRVTQPVVEQLAAEEALCMQTLGGAQRNG